MKKDIQSLVESSNAFALNLYSKLGATQGNLCISPFSIYTAIGEENNSLSFFKKPVMMWIGRICLLLFLLMPFTKTYLNFLFLGGWYDPFQLALLFLFFTSLIANSEHFFILGTKPVVLFGEISYGFYMAHRPILKITQTHFGTTGLNLVAAFVLTLLFAFLSYKLIEEPSRKWLVKKFK